MPTIQLFGFDLTNLTDRISTMPWLDAPAAKLHSLTQPIFGPDGPAQLKDALYGTWLGHPLHPMATDLPIGFWTSSFVLDLAGMQRGADITLKLGTLSAVGAAASGIAQWFDLQEMDAPRRVGTLHAMINVAATSAYAASWYLRDHDRRTAGIVASSSGMALASLGGLLGGDLSFRLGIGVSRVAFEEPPEGWTAVIPASEVEAGRLVRVEHDSGPVVLLRQDDQILAVSATCTHVGAPLDEGEVEGSCVVCPWHGSMFDMHNGHVVHGPATSALHAYDARVVNDQIEIRLQNP
jgi:nitrite reductase/ring-hydroxylating ferredoxin subunit/uncharacterized membrane protein